MRTTLSLASLALCALTAGVEAADTRVDWVDIVQCQGADGTAEFRDRCPAGMQRLGERRIRTTNPVVATVEAAAKSNPVTLYVVPECDACDLVRNRLKARELPYTEKDVQDDPVSQEELKAASGGLTVPALVVGGEVVRGYSSDAVDSALDAAGYPPATPAPVAEPAATTAATP